MQKRQKPSYAGIRASISNNNNGVGYQQPVTDYPPQAKRASQDAQRLLLIKREKSPYVASCSSTSESGGHDRVSR